MPEYNPLEHRPAAHPQRARVVGLEGESIHVDQWGRIKVRFLFTRADDHSHDGGAGSNDNDTDSAWVDVLTLGRAGYGARFLPRVGEIVVIDSLTGTLTVRLWWAVFMKLNVTRPSLTRKVSYLTLKTQRHPL